MSYENIVTLSVCSLNLDHVLYQHENTTLKQNPQHFTHLLQHDTCQLRPTTDVFTARCTIVQNALLWSHVVRL